MISKLTKEIDHEICIRDIEIFNLEQALSHAMSIIIQWEDSTEEERKMFNHTNIREYLKKLPAYRIKPQNVNDYFILAEDF